MMQFGMLPTQSSETDYGTPPQMFLQAKPVRLQHLGKLGEKLTSLPSPFKIFQRTHTNCSLSLVELPSLATLTARSLSLMNVANKTDLNGLMAIG